MASFGVSVGNVFELLDDDAPQQSKSSAAPVTSEPKRAAAKPANQQSNSRPAAEQSNNNNNNENRPAYTPRGGRGGFRGDSRGGSDRGGRGGSRGRGGRGGFQSNNNNDRGDSATIAAVDGDVSGGGYSEVSGDSSRPRSTRGNGPRGARAGFGGRGRGFGDGSRREFDRRGAPRGRGPHEARKGGIGLGDPTEIVEADSELGQQPTAGDEATTAEASGETAEAPAEDLSGIEEIQTAPEDSSLSYDDFLAQQRAKAVADDNLTDRIRRVEIDDKQWKSVKPLASGKTEESVDEEEAEARRLKNAAKKGAKGKLSLDEFVGSPSGAGQQQSSRGNEESGDGGRGGFRGGRGGFRGGDRGSERGGRGGFRGESRGGRGRGGERGGYRGGRGGSRGSSNVNILDESAFPALGGK